MKDLGRTLWTKPTPLVIVLLIMGKSDLRSRNAKPAAVSEASGIAEAGLYVFAELPLAVFRPFTLFSFHEHLVSPCV
jgi:hypothetical protein